MKQRIIPTLLGRCFEQACLLFQEHPKNIDNGVNIKFPLIPCESWQVKWFDQCSQKCQKLAFLMSAKNQVFWLTSRQLKVVTSNQLQNDPKFPMQGRKLPDVLASTEFLKLKLFLFNSPLWSAPERSWSRQLTLFMV